MFLPSLPRQVTRLRDALHQDTGFGAAGPWPKGWQDRPTLASIKKRPQEMFLKYTLPLIAADDDMMKLAGKLYAGRARHEASTATRPMDVTYTG